MEPSPKIPFIKKLLVVGDSITYHGASKELEWFGQWGMAASSQASDYVHQLLARITDYQGSEPELKIMAEGGGTLAGQLKQIHRMEECMPDVAVIQMGENDRDISTAGFQEPYEKIIRAIQSGNPKVIVLCTGTWGPPHGCPEKDDMIRNACRSCHAIFVNISRINSEPNASALAEKRYRHDGVNWHPGNKAMGLYAETLWQALLAPECSDSRELQPPALDQMVLEEKWDGLSAFNWNGLPQIDHNSCCAFFGGEAEKSAAIAEAALPIERLRGNRVTLSTLVKADVLAEVECSLQLTDAEGKGEIHEAVIDGPPGTWAPLSLRLRIPENIIGAKLRMGRKSRHSAVWFKSISISSNNRP